MMSYPKNVGEVHLDMSESFFGKHKESEKLEWLEGPKKIIFIPPKAD